MVIAIKKKGYLQKKDQVMKARQKLQKKKWSKGHSLFYALCLTADIKVQIWVLTLFGLQNM